MLARELENELNLSLYSLSSKTSRYAHFDHNRLAVYGIRLAAFMLPLRQKFKFQNIRHALFEIRIAVYHIRLSGLSFATVTAIVKYFLNLQFDPKLYKTIL